ncbi:MAG: Asp/Glu/hydantoin racemase [Hyphomicrobiaceae bacterium]|jgi:Asp/Glu/hydantoin racemase
MQLRGGKQYYGEAIGILIFDDRRYPTLPGDVANASTYDFPVRLKVVKGLVNVPPPTAPGPFEGYPADVQLLVRAVEELNEDGVRAVVTACGFFSGVQEVLAQASRVPVFTSSLMLIPIIAQMIGQQRKVGVLTASKDLLTPDFLESVGVNANHNIVIAGAESSAEYYATHMGGKRLTMDVDLMRAELVDVARELHADNPDMGALLVECSNFPSFSTDFQEATGLPVFDYIAFIELMYRSVVQRPYNGFL